MSINLSKSEFGCAGVMYLGHKVGQGHVKPVEAKVLRLLTFPCQQQRNKLWDC